MIVVEVETRGIKLATPEPMEWEKELQQLAAANLVGVPEPKVGAHEVGSKKTLPRERVDRSL